MSRVFNYVFKPFSVKIFMACYRHSFGGWLGDLSKTITLYEIGFKTSFCNTFCGDR